MPMTRRSSENSRQPTSPEMPSLLRSSTSPPRPVCQVKGPVLGVRHVIKFDGLGEQSAKRAAAFLDSTRRGDGSFMHYESCGPNSEAVQTSSYADRPLADRARKAETLSIASILDDLRISHTDANGRDGVVVDGWTPLVTCAYGIDTGRAIATLHEAELQARGVDVAALRDAIDARPRRSRAQGAPQRNARWRTSDVQPAHDPSTTPREPDARNHDGQTQAAPPAAADPASRHPAPHIVPSSGSQRDPTIAADAHQRPHLVPPPTTPDGIMPERTHLPLDVDMGDAEAHSAQSPG